MELLFFLILMSVDLSFARMRLLKLKKVQSDGTLDGVGCAIEDPINYGGGNFNVQSKKCTKLSTDWFTNPVLETGSNYFSLVSLEKIGVKNGALDDEIPAISFAVQGGAIELTIKTTNTPLLGIECGRVEFSSNGGIRVVIQKMFGDVWRFTADRGNTAQEMNPMDQAQTTYKLVYYINSNYLNVLVDGAFFYNFQHRYDSSMYQRIKFVPLNSAKFLCERWFGSPFHHFGPVTANDLSAIHVRVLGTQSREVLLEDLNL